MKNNIMKAVSALPFCIPFPFILLAIDYYLNNVWFVIPVVTLLGALSFGYVAAGKVPEMLAGDSVGILISCVITSILNNGFDESWFTPLTSTSYLILLAAVILIVQLLAIPIVRLCKKIKSKNKNDGKTLKKLKNTRFFLWLDKGTKIQVFIKKLIAVAVLMLALYWAGYGVGTLVGLMGF